MFPPSLARLSPSQEEILKPCKFPATNAAFIHQITDLPRRVSFQAPAHSQLSRTLQVAPHNKAHASRKSSCPELKAKLRRIDVPQSLIAKIDAILSDPGLREEE